MSHADLSAEVPPRPPRLRSWGFAYAPAAALAILLPKCPLCIAAPLGLIGLSIPLPGAARELIILTSLALGTLFLLRRRKRGSAACCSTRTDRRIPHEHDDGPHRR